jgi:hypothetical protein
MTIPNNLVQDLTLHSECHQIVENLEITGWMVPDSLDVLTGTIVVSRNKVGDSEIEIMVQR